MKSLFIWLVSLVIGAGCGYLISWYISLTLFIGVPVGLILGSSLGITINIHRDKGPNLDELAQQDPLGR